MSDFAFKASQAVFLPEATSKSVLFRRNEILTIPGVNDDVLLPYPVKLLLDEAAENATPVLFTVVDEQRLQLTIDAVREYAPQLKVVESDGFPAEGETIDGGICVFYTPGGRKTVGDATGAWVEDFTATFHVNQRGRGEDFTVQTCRWVETWNAVFAKLETLSSNEKVFVVFQTAGGEEYAEENPHVAVAVRMRTNVTSLTYPPVPFGNYSTEGQKLGRLQYGLYKNYVTLIFPWSSDHVEYGTWNEAAANPPETDITYSVSVPPPTSVPTYTVYSYLAHPESLACDKTPAIWNMEEEDYYGTVEKDLDWFTQSDVSQDEQDLYNTYMNIGFSQVTPSDYAVYAMCGDNPMYFEYLKDSLQRGDLLRMVTARAASYSPYLSQTWCEQLMLEKDLQRIVRFDTCLRDNPHIPNKWLPDSDI